MMVVINSGRQVGLYLLLHDDVLVDDLVAEGEGDHVEQVDVAALCPHEQLAAVRRQAHRRDRLQLAASTQRYSH